MGRVLLCSFLSALLVTAICAAPEAVLVSVSPRVGMAPFATRARITVEPDDLNRQVCLRLMEDDLTIRTTCWPLDGLAGPRTISKDYQDIESGDYDLIATVTRAQGRNPISVPKYLQVMGRE